MLSSPMMVMGMFVLQPLALATRAGNQIPNWQRLEQAPGRLAVAALAARTQHPSARLRSSTGVYNCYGLVFASRRTWVDNDQGGVVEMILRDDKYRRITLDECQVGDVVVYRGADGNIAHVGLIAETRPLDANARVLSQWGADGEYLHDLHDVYNWLGQPADYWTDRKP